MNWLLEKMYSCGNFCNCSCLLIEYSYRFLLNKNAAQPNEMGKDVCQNLRDVGKSLPMK